MLRESQYLSLKPSQVAAASLILAINISTSDLANRLGIQKMHDLNLKSLFFENVISIEMDGVRQHNKNEHCPLKIWNKMVRRVTQLSIKKDLVPAYQTVCIAVDKNVLNGQLADFPELLVQGSDLTVNARERSIRQ